MVDENALLEGSDDEIASAICEGCQERVGVGLSIHHMDRLCPAVASGRSRAAPAVGIPVLRRVPVTFRPASIPDGVTQVSIPDRRAGSGRDREHEHPRQGGGRACSLARYGMTVIAMATLGSLRL